MLLDVSLPQGHHTLQATLTGALGLITTLGGMPCLPGVPGPPWF